MLRNPGAGWAGLGVGSAERMSFSPLPTAAAAPRSEVEEMCLRAILETSRDAIVVADEQGQIVSWSKVCVGSLWDSLSSAISTQILPLVYQTQGAEDMFGYSESEVRGKSLQILMPYSYRMRHQAALTYEARHSGGGGSGSQQGKLRRYNNIYDVRGLSKSGDEFPIQISVSSFTVKGKLQFTGIIRDLSQEITDTLSAGTGTTKSVDMNQLAVSLRLRRGEEGVALPIHAPPLCNTGQAAQAAGAGLGHSHEGCARLGERLVHHAGRAQADSGQEPEGLEDCQLASGD